MMVCVEGDIVNVDCYVHDLICEGASASPVSASQNKLKVQGKAVLVDGDTFSYHDGTGTVNASQTKMKVGGKAVIVDGDSADSPPHSNSGIVASQSKLSLHT